MPGSPLLNSAAELFKSAGTVQEGISDRAYKAEQDAADNRNKLNTETLSTALQTTSGERRTAMTEQGANTRQQAEIQSQFLTLTPQLKKGAADLTGDSSWHDIPDNYRMRADVYSALIGAGTKMAEYMKPKVIDVQEGDQVYKMEYDPKTKSLTRLSSGGAKWSPKESEVDTTGKLNPFTLQNIVRQDEKTLLTQLGNKGDKGIPQAGPIDKFLHVISLGKIDELSDTEKAKLATLQSLAGRLRNNYTNLQKVEEAKGLSPTQVDPQVLDVINKLVTPEQAAPAAGTKVLMKAPDGRTGYINSDKMQEALKRGFTKA